jgi:3-isopropylmalate dehydratase small subunit
VLRRRSRWRRLDRCRAARALRVRGIALSHGWQRGSRFRAEPTNFRSAPFLIAGENFGCGSSREGAVWALMAAGFRSVIVESFGDIFYNNCFQNGMLPIVLPAVTVAADSGFLLGFPKPSKRLRQC